MSKSNCKKVEQYKDSTLITLTAVQSGDKWGYINSNNEEIINPIFEAAFPFCDKYAAVKMEDKWGYIDQRGEFVLPPLYDSVEKTNFWPDGYISVSLNGEYGVLDAEFNEIIAPQYDEIGEFVYDAAAVRTGDRWGVIDTCGKQVAPIIYARAEPAPQRMAFVATAFDNDTFLWGMVDKGGNYIIPTSYLRIKHFHNDLIVCKKINGKHILFDYNGKVVIDGWSDTDYFAPQGYNYGAISIASNGITTHICTLSTDHYGKLVANLSGEFTKWHLSPNGYLWVEDKARHITIYNNEGSIVGEKSDIHIVAATRQQLVGEGISDLDYSIMACRDEAGMLILFDEFGGELNRIEEAIDFDNIYITSHNHIIAIGQKKSAIISLKYNKLLKIPNAFKVYALSEDIIAYVDKFIYSWKDNVKLCAEKGCSAQTSDEFIIGTVKGSNLYTLLTSLGRLLLQDSSNHISLHNGCCIVDYADRCDIYDADGNCCSVYGYHHIEDIVDFEYGVIPLVASDGCISIFNTKADKLLTFPADVNMVAPPRGNVIPVFNQSIGLWGLVDRDGKRVSDYIYKSIFPRNMEVTHKCLAYNYGVPFTHISFNGKNAIRRIFERERSFTIIDNNGKEHIPLVQGYISDTFCPENYYKLTFNNRETGESHQQLVKIDGNNLSYSTKFEDLDLRTGVFYSGDKQGLIDIDTYDVVLPPIFDDINIRCRGGIIKVRLAGKSYEFAPDLTLTRKWDVGFDHTIIFSENY